MFRSRLAKRLMGVCVAVGATLALASPSVHAGRTNTSPIEAATLGIKAPTTQEIQREIDFVHSEGLSISVVGHFLRPAMVVPIHGEPVLAANVPVVAMVVGGASSSSFPSNTESGAMAAVPAARPGNFTTVASTHMARPEADTYYHWEWTDTANGPSGGEPTLKFTAHYDVVCSSTCFNEMSYVTHEADKYVNYPTLYGTFFGDSCTTTAPSLIKGGGTSWGAEYLTYDSLTCAQGSTHIWSTGGWAWNGSGFNSYFTDNHDGTTSSPGDWVAF